MRKNRNGSATEDRLLLSLKGEDLITSATTDVMDLHKEAYFIYYELFPPYRKPVEENPKRYTLEEDYFYFSQSPKKIKVLLQDYFLNNHSQYRDRMYGSGESLARFFGSCALQLVTTGKVFYEIIWEEVEIEGKKYFLPGNFSYLPTHTMKAVCKGNKIAYYIQKYSLFTYLKNKLSKSYSFDKIDARSTFFKKDEILFLKYPLSKISPTYHSLGMLPKADYFSRFSLSWTQASAERDNHQLRLEVARYKNYLNEQKKSAYARARIRRLYNYLPIENNNTKITQYYDIYTCIRYLKYMNLIREYLVREFNDQVIKVFAEKNNLKHVPTLQYRGFMDNKVLNDALKSYKQGKLSYEKVVEEVISKYKLFK